MSRWDQQAVFLPDICLTGVHNEIHDIQQPCLVKYFKWLLKVMAGKGHTLFSDQTTEGTFGSPKGTVPFGRGLAKHCMGPAEQCTRLTVYVPSKVYMWV